MVVKAKGATVILAGITKDKKRFECSGVIVATNKGLELVKKTGEVVQIGVFENEYNGINTSLVFNKEIRYIGCRSQKTSSWEKAIDLMASGLIVPEKIVTKVVDLERWREVFENSMNCEEVKVVIKID